jgi:ABC-type glycerol-3-phosphate transport system substrate-binding protein
MVPQRGERNDAIMSHEPEDTVESTPSAASARTVSRKDVLKLGAATAVAAAATPSLVAETARARAVDVRVLSSPVTLTFFNRITGSNLPVINTLLAKFTKETGIKVNNATQPSSGATYQPAVRTAFASSSPPDIADDIAGPEVYNLARAGVIRDITSFYNSPTIQARVTAGATTGAVLDGKVWGLSDGVSVGNILWYNPDYLKKYGVNASTIHTWSQFLQACQTIKKGGGTPIIIGAKDLWPGGHWLTDLTQRALGDTATNTLYNRTVVPGSPATPKWTDPAVVAAFQGLVDVSQYFQDGAVGESQGAADGIFLQGGGGFYEMGSWFTSTILQQKPSFTPGLMLFPSLNGYPGLQMQVTIANGILMASTRAPQDAIEKFYLFWTRPDNVRYYSENTATIMPYKYDTKNLSVAAPIRGIFAQVVSFLNNAGPNGAILFNDEAVDVNMYTKYIWQGSVALLSGALKPAQLLSQLEAATEAFQKSHPKT